MSKASQLLKKVEVFEKLAKYGDRSSFLKSLAQPIPANPNTTPVLRGDEDVQEYLKEEFKSVHGPYADLNYEEEATKRLDPYLKKEFRSDAPKKQPKDFSALNKSREATEYQVLKSSVETLLNKQNLSKDQMNSSLAKFLDQARDKQYETTDPSLKNGYERLMKLLTGKMKELQSVQDFDSMTKSVLNKGLSPGKDDPTSTGWKSK